MIIVQRGRRRKPITWSPVDYDKSVILAPPKDQVGPEAPKKCEINPRLRRRLVMSPTKTNPSADWSAYCQKA
nr:unnamed protein product [Callosobruchus chinensis]